MKEENNDASLFEAFGAGKLSESSENQFIRTFLIGQERERLKALRAENPHLMGQEQKRLEASTEEPAKIRPLFNLALYGYRRVAVAAVLLVVAVPFFLWKSPSAKDNMDKAIMESVALSGNLMGKDTSAIWQQAYKAKQYDQVTTLLDEQNISNGDDFFYLGISSLQKKPADFEKAIRCFEKAKESNKRISELPWWLGVTYYHQGNLEKCKEMLLQIQEGQFKYKEAQKILSKMDNQ